MNEICCVEEFGNCDVVDGNVIRWLMLIRLRYVELLYLLFLALVLLPFPPTGVHVLNRLGLNL